MKFAIATARKFWQIINKKKLIFLLMLAIATYCSITIIQPVIATRNQTADNPNLSTQLSQSNQPSLLEQGSRLYAQGNLTEAVATWQKALFTYRLRQNTITEKLRAQLNEALCLNYLSMAYQELGEWDQAQETIAQSANLLDRQLLASKEGLAIAARISNTQGSLQLAMGNPQAALDNWKIAAERYTQLDDEIGLLGSQTNQAQALQALGLFRLASEQLEAIELRLQKQPDSLLKSVALHSLGTTLQTLGDLAKSQKILEQSLAIAQNLNNPAESSATLISIGNNFRFIKDIDGALQKYEQAAKTSPVSILRLEAQALSLSLLVESDRLQQVLPLWQQIEPELTKLQPSRRSVYLSVNLSESLMKIKDPDARPITTSRIAELLTVALRQAQSIQDRRAESFAIGALGGLYEQNQQLTEAYQLSQRALLLAQSISADDLLYRWQWLSGRILNKQGKSDLAIAAYSQAIKNIQNLRRELVATSPEVQFAFRDRIEPIYRELVSLLLKSDKPSQENLIQARLTLESLQVVELENFFRAACLNIQPQQIDAVDSNSAVIYSAILSDHLALILSLPKEPLQYFSSNISQTELEDSADQFLQALNPAFSDRIRLKVSQKLYDLIIRPSETALADDQTFCFGIDVSQYQGPINWDEVLLTKHPLRFVIARATMGRNGQDLQFVQNWQNLKRVGLQRGAYHYYRPFENSTEQAANFIAHVNLTKGDFPPVLDIERMSPLGPANLRKGVLNWLRLVEKHFRCKPIVYTGRYFYERYLKGSIDVYPLWIASYGPHQKVAHLPWTFYQFSEKLVVHGIDASVDGNFFQGSLTKLRNFGL